MGSKQVETLREVWRLFHEALEKKGGERADFLKEACRNDSALKKRVEELLHAHENAPGFLESPAISRPAPPSSELPSGNQLGQYFLLKEIGRGGMGVIYEAEQTHPHRKVALKLLHGALASKNFLNRFEREAEILGRLQHPGIAQVFESGSIDTPTGPQPYFAMELVRGKTLVEYCEERNLSTRERLKLLIQIAQAVQYAHQQGVIHRDLKPGNVLVDQSEQIKILDFGVARIQSAELQEKTLQTKGGDFLGTLPYMSPEQLGAHPESVDTRTDVYALGVIGYELLAERLPFEVSEISLTEAVRIISHDAPSLLGTFNREFRGDLETIFAKALEKERERRYASASEFWADIQRYLDSKPILARAPSASYQLRKFVARHKLSVSSLCALFLSLCGFLAYATIQANRLEEERDRALNAEKLAEDKAELAFDAEKLAQEKSEETAAQIIIANAAAEKALKISGFFQDMFVEAIPEREGSSITLLDALEISEKKIEAELSAFPESEREIRIILSQIYSRVGKKIEAQVQAKRVLEICETAFGENHPFFVHALILYGGSFFGTATPEEGVRHLKRAVSLGASIPTVEAPTLLSAKRSLGDLYQQMKRPKLAKEAYFEALEMSKLVFGEDYLVTFEIRNNIGSLLVNLQQDEAEPFLKELLADCERVGADQAPVTAFVAANLTICLYRKKQFAEAKVICRRALDLYEKEFGKNHPDTLSFAKKAEVILAAKE